MMGVELDPNRLFWTKKAAIRPGTDVMIFKVFSPKNSAKNGVFDSKQS
jgi:hypothetical protein